MRRVCLEVGARDPQVEPVTRPVLSSSPVLSGVAEVRSTRAGDVVDPAANSEAKKQALDVLEEQLAAIRDTEKVNQKLFDSLHQELVSYRDNFVRDSFDGRRHVRGFMFWTTDSSLCAR